MLLTSDSQFENYKTEQDRIILIDGLFFRKYYGQTGGVNYYGFFIPKQLVVEVFQRLHGELRRHRTITKLLFAYRRNYYYVYMAQLIRTWVMSCEQCDKESLTDNRVIKTPVQNHSEHTRGIEGVMQMDAFPEMLSSSGYGNLVTALDVFSRYLFVYPRTSQVAKTIARVVNNLMTKNDYFQRQSLPTKHQPFDLKWSKK